MENLTSQKVHSYPVSDYLRIGIIGSVVLLAMLIIKVIISISLKKDEAMGA